VNLWKKTKQTNIKQRNPNTGKPKRRRKDRQTPYIQIPHLTSLTKSFSIADAAILLQNSH